MATNTFSPNGFQPVRRLDGAAWTASQRKRLIASGNSTSIYYGDPVVQLSTGYIDAVVPGSLPTQGTLGIFVGCEKQGVTNGTPWSAFYDGSSSQDVKAYVIDDPLVVMRVWVGTGSSSAAGGPVTFADIGQNISYSLGTGNTLSGISGAYVNYVTLNTTSTLPFTIYGLVTDPPGSNGTAVAAGNLIEVVFNQQWAKVGTTGL